MLVGYQIGSVTGHEQEALDFLLRTAFFTDPKIPHNILLSAGSREINIFTQNTTMEEIAEQLFEVTPISVGTGNYLAVNTANFLVEAEIAGQFRRLLPTQYIQVTPQQAMELRSLVKLGTIEIIPKLGTNEV